MNKNTTITKLVINKKHYNSTDEHYMNTTKCSTIEVVNGNPRDHLQVLHHPIHNILYVLCSFYKIITHNIVWYHIVFIMHNVNRKMLYYIEHLSNLLLAN